MTLIHYFDIFDKNPKIIRTLRKTKGKMISESVINKDSFKLTVVHFTPRWKSEIAWLLSRGVELSVNSVKCEISWEMCSSSMYLLSDAMWRNTASPSRRRAKKLFVRDLRPLSRCLSKAKLWELLKGEIITDDNWHLNNTYFGLQWTLGHVYQGYDLSHQK